LVGCGCEANNRSGPAIARQLGLAFTAMMPDEKKESAVAFLDAAIACFKAHGIAGQRVMTDNGSVYRSAAFAKANAAHGLKHKRTRPQCAENQRQRGTLHSDQHPRMGPRRALPD
jgi:transposase InsO family protein